MQVTDDTPEPGKVPHVYPKRPPLNLLLDQELLHPTNLFAFEGIDGSGKSALTEAIARRYTERGGRAILMKLGRSDLVRHALPRAMWVNSDPMSFNLLNWTSVFEQVTENQRVLNADLPLLFDRYVLTIKVRGILEGLASDFMELLESQAPRPRIVFLLDCDPDVSLDRIMRSGRGITYFEAGARIVEGQGEPMVEADPAVRRRDAPREALLLNHLARMRELFQKLAAGYDNVYRLEARRPLEELADEVMDVIAT